MLACFMDHQRTIWNRPVQNLVRYRWPGECACVFGVIGNELEPTEDNGILGVRRGVVLDLADHEIRVFGRDVELSGGQVESVQRHSSKPQMHVAIGDSWNYRVPLKVDDLGVRRPVMSDFLITAHRINRVLDRKSTRLN